MCKSGLGAGKRSCVRSTGPCAQGGQPGARTSDSICARVLLPGSCLRRSPLGGGHLWQYQLEERLALLAVVCWQPATNADASVDATGAQNTQDAPPVACKLLEASWALITSPSPAYSPALRSALLTHVLLNLLQYAPPACAARWFTQKLGPIYNQLLPPFDPMLEGMQALAVRRAGYAVVASMYRVGAF